MKKVLILFSIFYFLFSPAVSAAELYFGTHSKEVGVGKTFEVGVFLNTQDEVINAVEGKIVFPAEKVELVDIIDGNSIINLWVEKAHLDAPGEVFFSGIVPGGYFGQRGYLLSLVLKVKNTGPIIIQTDNERILLNDGEGTETSVKRAPIALNAVTETEVEAFLPPYDPDPPELFIPIVSQDPNVFNDQYFLSFATQDKISGIDHYEIKETKYPSAKLRAGKSEGLRGWRIGESPYLLQDQKLNSYLFVKALDKAGNERVAMLAPQNPLPWYKNYQVWIIIILVALALYLIDRQRSWRKVINTLRPRR